jgi:hypothetical protein
MLSNWKAFAQGSVSAIFAAVIWQLNSMYSNELSCMSVTGCYRISDGTMFLLVLILSPLLLILPDINAQKSNVIWYYTILFGTSTSLALILIFLMQAYGLRNLGMGM